MTSDVVATPGVMAVDLGNTAAKSLASDFLADHRVPSFRSPVQTFALSQDDWPQRIVAWAAANVRQVRQWRLASVNRQALAKLKAAIAASSSAETICLTHHDVPIAVNVPRPEAVGIDRLLGAFAIAGITRPAEPGLPAVLVDAGSAITIDWIDAAGVFQGGAILPGLNLQASSLASGTDLLPQIEWIGAADLPSPGKDTVAAIRLGIMTAVIAAIEKLRDQYAGDTSTEPTVWLTGGDAAAISPHLTAEHLVCRDLVCRGILRCQGVDAAALGPRDC